MGFQEAKARRNIWLKGKNRVQRAAEIGIVQYHAALVALCYGSINAFVIRCYFLQQNQSPNMKDCCTNSYFA